MEAKVKRSYVSQVEVPRLSLAEAMRIGQALTDHYGRHPTKPLRIAEALGMSPSSGGFRNMTSASVAYGLTDGSAWASEISLTSLGTRVFAPTQKGDDLSAKREAILRPRVCREFLNRYNDAKLPSPQIAHNVLAEMGIPSDAAKRAFEVILHNARDVGILREINGQTYVDLHGAEVGASLPEETPDLEVKEPVTTLTDSSSSLAARPVEITSKISTQSGNGSTREARVFITHGSNKAVVEQLKELLGFGKFTPIVAVEIESTAKAVSEKILSEMRRCEAAVIHVGAELKVMDTNGEELTMLNPNVLIEIGAALALYGNRFILLVEEGVNLPTNLQGLYEVRYSGTKLDYEATMKLLKAFNEFRSQDLVLEAAPA